jgi:hypothetical protein
MTSCLNEHVPVPVTGVCENNRNAQNKELYKAIMHEVHGPGDVICGHHLIYVQVASDGKFNYEITQEMPSADYLIFNHDIARKIWGDGFKRILARLACEPTEMRDKLMADLYNNRPDVMQWEEFRV